MRNNIVDALNLYVNELGKEVNRISNDWNDTKLTESQQSALISSFVTFVKQHNLPIKHIGKFDIDKIPMFFNKKPKLKKSSCSSSRGHNFTDHCFLTVKAVCSKCQHPFWGIGYQGLICQSNFTLSFRPSQIAKIHVNKLNKLESKCDLKLHRSCYSNGGIPFDCVGTQKNIKTEYKEKFDNFQKILFGVGKISKIKTETINLVLLIKANIMHLIRKRRREFHPVRHIQKYFLSIQPNRSGHRFNSYGARSNIISYEW